MSLDPFRDAVVVDIETASLADIKTAGAWVYAQHPSTHVYCVVFESLDGRFHWTWRLDHREEMPVDLREAIDAGCTLVAHNVSFEHGVWTHILHPLLGFPAIDTMQWRDTQAMGLARNLPSTLEGLAAALGSPVAKDKAGAKLMRKMAKAVDVEGDHYVLPMATDENLELLVDYCTTDVRATSACYAKLRGKMSLSEERLWRKDQEINRRGVYLDKQFARRCLQLATERKAYLNERLFTLTSGELCGADPGAMKRWLTARDVKLPSVKRPNGTRSATLDTNAVTALLDTDLDPIVREVLECRREASSATSLAKLHRIFSMTGPDGRLYDALQFCAAHTGRWASYGLQLHNMPRVLLEPHDLQLARTVVEHGDMATLAMLFDRPLKVLSQLLRSTVAAPPGYELIAGDFSAIEARVVAWLAGQDDVLQLFAAKEDVYTHVAQKLGSDIRQLGKVATLMLGFGAGAVKSRDTFGDWGVHMTFAETKRVVDAWRSLNPKIVQFWRDLQDAVHAAVEVPGRTFCAGRIDACCTSGRQCLVLRLPSGRLLRYWRPHLRRTVKTVSIVNDVGEVERTEIEGPELQFFTPGRDRVRMTCESTYGGKLAENVTQAVARDLLGEALLRFRDPYRVVIHVHDSLASQVPTGRGDVAEFRWLMEESPAWADGLPIAVDGYRDTRFRG